MQNEQKHNDKVIPRKYEQLLLWQHRKGIQFSGFHFMIEFLHIMLHLQKNLKNKKTLLGWEIA